MNPNLNTTNSNSMMQRLSVSNRTNSNSLINTITITDLNKTRSSPSFNDSEPPSYFEVISTIPTTMAMAPVTMRQQNRPLSISSKYLSENDNNNNTSTFRQATVIYQHDGEPNVPNAPVVVNGDVDCIDCCSKPSETYMVWSIFTTIYCVFIGIFALFISFRVRNYNKRGNFKEAYALSRIVWYLNIAGLFFGIVYLAIALLTCLLPRA